MTCHFWGQDSATFTGYAAARLLCASSAPPTHNREPYDTLLYCPTSCPYRSVCGTDAACRLQYNIPPHSQPRALRHTLLTNIMYVPMDPRAAELMPILPRA